MRSESRRKILNQSRQDSTGGDENERSNSWKGGSTSAVAKPVTHTNQASAPHGKHKFNSSSQSHGKNAWAEIYQPTQMGVLHPHQKPIHYPQSDSKKHSKVVQSGGGESGHLHLLMDSVASNSRTKFWDSSQPSDMLQLRRNTANVP